MNVKEIYISSYKAYSKRYNNNENFSVQIPNESIIRNDTSLLLSKYNKISKNKKQSNSQCGTISLNNIYESILDSLDFSEIESTKNSNINRRNTTNNKVNHIRNNANITNTMNNISTINNSNNSNNANINSSNNNNLIHSNSNIKTSKITFSDENKKNSGMLNTSNSNKNIQSNNSNNNNNINPNSSVMNLNETKNDEDYRFDYSIGNIDFEVSQSYIARESLLNISSNMLTNPSIFRFKDKNDLSFNVSNVFKYNEDEENDNQNAVNMNDSININKTKKALELIGEEQDEASVNNSFRNNKHDRSTLSRDNNLKHLDTYNLNDNLSNNTNNQAMYGNNMASTNSMNTDNSNNKEGFVYIEKKTSNKSINEKVNSNSINNNAFVSPVNTKIKSFSGNVDANTRNKNNNNLQSGGNNNWNLSNLSGENNTNNSMNNSPNTNISNNNNNNYNNYNVSNNASNNNNDINTNISNNTINTNLNNTNTSNNINNTIYTNTINNDNNNIKPIVKTNIPDSNTINSNINNNISNNNINNKSTHNLNNNTPTKQVFQKNQIPKLNLPNLNSILEQDEGTSTSMNNTSINNNLHSLSNNFFNNSNNNSKNNNSIDLNSFNNNKNSERNDDINNSINRLNNVMNNSESINNTNNSDISDKNTTYSKLNNTVAEENTKQHTQLDSLLEGFIINRTVSLKSKTFNLYMSSSDIKSFVAIEDEYFLEKFYVVLNKESYSEKNLKNLVDNCMTRYESFFLLICYYYSEISDIVRNSKDSNKSNSKIYLNSYAFKKLKENVLNVLNQVKELLITGFITLSSVDMYIIKPSLLYRLYDNTAELKDIISYYDLNKLFFIKICLKQDSVGELIKAYHEIKLFANDYNAKEENSHVFLYYFGKIIALLLEDVNSIQDNELVNLFNTSKKSNFERISFLLKSYNTINLKKRGKHLINSGVIYQYYIGESNEVNALFKEGRELLNKFKGVK